MTNTDEVFAIDQMRLAIWAIRDRHPLIGGFLDQMTLCTSSIHDRIVVGVQNDQLVIEINPRWIFDADLDEIEAALIHEALHLLLGHHRQDGHGFDHRLLDKAKDLAVSEFNDEDHTPGEEIPSSNYHSPSGESIKERYDRMLTEAPASSVPATLGANKEVASSTQDRNATDEAKPIHPPSMVSSATNSIAGEPAAGQPSMAVCTTPLRPLGEPESNQFAVIAAIMAGAASVQDVSDLSDMELNLIKELPGVSIGQGSHPLGELEGIAGHTAEEAVPWKRTLRRFVGRARPARRSSYLRPNRRLPKLFGIVPGRKPGPGRPHIQVTIDTSGSMTGSMLSMIASELKYLSNRNRIMIVECDADIQRIYRFNGTLDSCRGRGGTSFTPPFQHSVIRQTRAELIVYFTDGYGDAPPDPPTIPVLWVIIGGGPVPAKWGESVRMEGEPQFKSGRGGSKTRRRSPRGMSGGGNQDVYFPP